MSDDNKAKKLAAARKKLKEYQSRSNAEANSVIGIADVAETVSLSSNISERSDSETNFNVNSSLEQIIDTTQQLQQENSIVTNVNDSTAIHLQSIPLTANDFNVSSNSSVQNLNAIQLLITEKGQLTSDLSKCRTQCREKELFLEELRVQHNNVAQRLEEVQQHYVNQQGNMEKLRNINAELQHKLAQALAREEEKTIDLNVLKEQLNTEHHRYVQLEDKLKANNNELEMTQIRVQQLSDESSLNKDDRIESLTQKQFMYEQQIRDLQAMVQQLSDDKEQANIQYQNYVQHLKAEVTSLTEKNSELTDECTKVQEHERQLIAHISSLERDIQKNISRQAQLHEEQQLAAALPHNEVAQQSEKMQEKINELHLERHEFQLKIKSQEDRLEELQKEQQQRENELKMLQEHLNQINSIQPDSIKLLATMESDKIAASRALAQNVEMKKQLDELEQRFVQLTNDKADLMNKLDAEQYANRDLRSQYASMEERLSNIDERYRLKDDEMIRLSHENMELSQKNALLLTQVKGSHENMNIINNDNHIEEHECLHNSADMNSSQAVSDNNSQNGIQIDSCSHDHDHNEIEQHISHDFSSKITTSPIPTEKAVEKLQERFTKLMSQVADLTDEKQRLEHLVLQLQSETETIGEYITLYQTQRRMLKQREYEKAAQMRLLQVEREQMREKIVILNNLVSSLGVKLPQSEEHFLNSATILPTMNKEKCTSDFDNGVTNLHSECIDNTIPTPSNDVKEITLDEKLNPTDTQDILTKIQNIISEIKEDTKTLPTLPTVDHLNCCLGKFEVI